MGIDQILAQIGLQETEAKFYLAALELGQASVRDIAAKAGISRTNAYDVFARLLEQRAGTQVGAASKQDHARCGRAAGAPSRAIRCAAQRSSTYCCPSCRSLHNRSSGKPRVRFYQGLEGIKLVLDDTLTARDKKLLGILSMRDLYEVPGREWMDDLVRRRIEGGRFPARHPIAGQGHPEVWPESTADLREVRFASRDFVFTMTSYIYDDKVAIISSRRENFAMTIESEEFAMMQRNLFEVFWACLSGSTARKLQGLPDALEARREG